MKYKIFITVLVLFIVNSLRAEAIKIGLKTNAKEVNPDESL